MIKLVTGGLKRTKDPYSIPIQWDPKARAAQIQDNENSGFYFLVNAVIERWLTELPGVVSIQIEQVFVNRSIFHPETMLEILIAFRVETYFSIDIPMPRGIPQIYERNLKADLTEKLVGHTRSLIKITEDSILVYNSWLKALVEQE